MVLLLQTRGRMTGTALAEELEVSVRTIYRDLEALGAAGIPVYAEPGPGGGCQLIEGYRSPLAGLTRDEAAALLTLGVPAVLNDLGIAPTMRSAQDRVRAVAGIPHADRRVHLDMPRWFHHREDTPHLAALADAIDRQRLLTIGYRSNRARAAKTATVSPLGLVNKAGVWYLVGVQPSGRMAVYRAGRIETLRVLDATFERPSDFDLVRYWETWSADFESSLPTVAVACASFTDRDRGDARDTRRGGATGTRRSRARRPRRLASPRAHLRTRRCGRLPTGRRRWWHRGAVARKRAHPAGRRGRGDPPAVRNLTFGAIVRARSVNRLRQEYLLRVRGVVSDVG